MISIIIIHLHIVHPYIFPHSTLSPTKYTITLTYIWSHSLPMMIFQVEFHGLSFNCGQNDFFELLIHKTIQSPFLVTPT